MPVLEQSTRERTKRAIYRCRNRECRAVKAADFQAIITTIVAQPPQGGRISRTTTTKLITDHGVITHGGIPGRDCNQCGTRSMNADWVQGSKSDRTCDPRCTGAVGAKCECSCAGANHGGSHL